MANITRIKAGNSPKKLENGSKKPENGPKKPEKAEKQAKKAPKNKFVRIITAPFRYIRNSWLELRQVRWPSRKATWKMVLAVFIYAALIMVLIMLLDVFFTWLFNLVLGK